MVMFSNKAKTVTEYLDALPEDRRAVVSNLRSFVRKHLPKGYKEQIGFGAITYAVPESKLRETYNGQPLCYAAIAAQKNHYSLYLMSAYGDPREAKKLADGFKKHGKKLDMGKSCLRFKSLDDLPLDVVGEVIASTPVDAYVQMYLDSRKKTPRPGSGQAAKGKVVQ